MQTRQQYEATGNYDRTDTWAYALRDAAEAYLRERPADVHAWLLDRAKKFEKTKPR